MTDTFDYAEALADADELIAEFGQAGTLSRPTYSGPSYNPEPGKPDAYPVTLVVLDYTDFELANGAGRILATDKKVLIAAGDLPGGFVVATSDRLEIGSQAHAIERVRPVNPGGTTVLFEVQARA